MSVPLRSTSFRALYRARRSRPVHIPRSPISIPVSLNSRRYVNGFSGPSPGQVGPQGDDAEEPPYARKGTPRLKLVPTLIKMFESSATTFASILVLG